MLTCREIEVIRSIAQGHPNKQIARMLGISEQTVKNHVTSIMHKLDVDGRTQAVLLAIRNGWISIDDGYHHHLDDGAGGMQMGPLLKAMVDRGASDLYLIPSSPPMVRVDGTLANIDSLPQLTPEATAQALVQVTTEEQRGSFEEELELDFVYAVPQLGRFRGNASLQGGNVSLAFRSIAGSPPEIEELGLPPICKELALCGRGLVLVTGPTGGGKSTTLAAMINYLNQSERRRIITIEDPIEYVHQSHMSIISQRELGSDTKSFAAALRHGLRQDPDVLLVGEIRDVETAQAVLASAETGHLVLSTAHAPSAAQAIGRIINLFPTEQHPLARGQLADVLKGVLYQMLVPRANSPGRIPVMEVMLATTAVRTLIREGSFSQLPSVIGTGAQHGMQTINQSLAGLYSKGLVSREVALNYASSMEEIRSLLVAPREQGDPNRKHEERELVAGVKTVGSGITN